MVKHLRNHRNHFILLAMNTFQTFLMVLLMCVTCLHTWRFVARRFEKHADQNDTDQLRIKLNLYQLRIKLR